MVVQVDRLSNWCYAVTEYSVEAEQHSVHKLHDLPSSHCSSVQALTFCIFGLQTSCPTCQSMQLVLKLASLSHGVTFMAVSVTAEQQCYPVLLCSDIQAQVCCNAYPSYACNASACYSFFHSLELQL